MNNQELFLAWALGLKNVSCYPYVWREKEREDEGEKKVKRIRVDGVTYGVQRVSIDDEIQEILNALGNALGERTKQILNLRFGLKDGKCKTYEEVGRDCGVSRARIGEIIKKSLFWLRHQSRYRRLRNLIILSPEEQFKERQRLLVLEKTLEGLKEENRSRRRLLSLEDALKKLRKENKSRRRLLKKETPNFLYIILYPFQFRPLFSILDPPAKFLNLFS